MYKFKKDSSPSIRIGQEAHHITANIDGLNFRDGGTIVAIQQETTIVHRVQQRLF